MTMRSYQATTARGEGTPDPLLDYLQRVTFTLYEVACVLQSITPATHDGIAVRQRVSDRCMDLLSKFSELKLKSNAPLDRTGTAGRRSDMENERKAAVPGTVGAVVLRHAAETAEILEVGRKAVEDVLVEFRDACISIPVQGNGFGIRDTEGKDIGVLIRLGTADGLRIALKAMADHVAENAVLSVSGERKETNDNA